MQPATEALRAAKNGYSWINHFERRRRTRDFRSVLQSLGGHGRALGDFKHDVEASQVTLTCFTSTPRHLGLG